SINQPLLDARQFVELVEGRRRGQRPLQRRGAFAPRVRFGRAATHDRLDQHQEEGGHADQHHHIAHGRDHVPHRIAVCIIHIPARHALQTQEVLREEDQIGAHEEEEELDVRQRLVELDAENLLVPVVETGEDR
ncbi:unnamed protein product, partial [Chrysoparadoxa australica]